MKSRMKIFATVTAVALVLGAFTLASCSNSSSSDDSSSGGNNSSEKSEAEKKWEETLEKLEAYVKLDDKIEGVDKTDSALKDYNDAWDNLQIYIKTAKETVQDYIDSGTEKEDAYDAGNTALGLNATSSIEQAYKALNDTNKKLAKSEGGASSGNNSSSGGNNSSSNNSSSGNGNSSGDNNASGLEGLWIIDESIDDENFENGYYFKGDTLYVAIGMDGKYYYFEDEKESISVSGDKIVSADGDELTFKITGNTLTLSMGDVSFTLNKVNSTPEKMSMSDFGPDLN